MESSSVPVRVVQLFSSTTVSPCNFPNTGSRAREMLAIAYRPAWAAPVSEVSSWNPTDLAALPSAVRVLFADRNIRHWEFDGGNKPANMARVAPGMNPSRWRNRSQYRTLSTEHLFLKPPLVREEL